MERAAAQGQLAARGGAAVRAVRLPGHPVEHARLLAIGRLADRAVGERGAHLPRRAQLQLLRLPDGPGVPVAVRGRRAGHRGRGQGQRRDRAVHGPAQRRRVRARVPPADGAARTDLHVRWLDGVRVECGGARYVDRSDGFLRGHQFWVFARQHDGHHVRGGQLSAVRGRGAGNVELFEK